VAFSLPGVYTVEECVELIGMAEEAGFSLRERISGKQAGPLIEGRGWGRQPTLRQHAMGPRLRETREGPMEYEPEHWEVTIAL